MPRQEQGPTMERLLIEIIREQNHAHQMVHRLERMVALLLKRGGGDDPAEQAELAAMTALAKTEADALEKMAKDAGPKA